MHRPEAKPQRRALLVLTCAALALCSCVAYRSGAGARSVPQAAGTARKTIGVLIRASGSYRGQNRPLPDYIVARWRAAVLDAYRDCGLFAEVREGIARDADLQATVRIENTVLASRGIVFLSGVSFFAIPSRSRDQFELKTTLSDGSGAVLASLTSADTVTTWYQLLLLPGTVFLSRDAVVSDTLYDLTLDTAAQAQRKGVI
jgi:hypothetical protein